MRFLIVSAVVACVCAEADPQLLLGGAALPYAVGSAVVATPPASPASTIKIAPVVAAAALPAIGYAGLGYAGLGHAGLGHAGLLLANGGANALPIVTIPALATAGYAPGASC